ncbi:hypothetical protein BJ973_007967 [Actinoplanes tereljensis]|uniref:Uncharacterized protein n=1 Tax=Paractinoplanes tereljensis TaxID=571912 RepID=A0A919NTN7_9ACTN|nr:hypothetical protein [Actinoplanes tereljensis]GIF24488.1 hypothetical protein Ate02nite_72180 [Actinoplanes tereljensis]
MRDAEPRAEDEETGLASVLSMARLLSGWGCLGVGALNLAMGAADFRYLLFHAVLLIAGIALLMAGGLHKRPSRIAWLVGGVVALLGFVIGTLPRTSAAVCCLSDYDKRHGFPFTLLAERSGHWHLDGGRAVADLLFWACVGMFALLTVTAATPAPPPVPAPPAATGRHAEPRAEAVDEENVRGLP